VTTEPPATAPTAHRLLAWTTSPLVLRRLALASVIVNILIVVTGGAVRLTNSGLGCPTWPKCTDSSLTPTHKYAVKGLIEFGNRTLTIVVGLTLLATLVVAWRQRRQVRLAALAFAGIPAQAVLGGAVTLTDLNPWVVAAHFLLSAAVIAVTVLLWWRIEEVAAVVVPTAARRLAQIVAVVAAAVLVFGTIVTGSGPHAGDLKAGKLHRIHLSSSGLTQLHADVVMVLIGVTVGMLAVTYALQVGDRVRRAAWLLLGIELAQGIIGYTQYFLHVPALLVGLHMFGACLVWVAALYLLLLVEPRASVLPAAVRAPG
jgi:cytochrome c oxidase assembly protein subunit 15